MRPADWDLHVHYLFDTGNIVIEYHCVNLCINGIVGMDYHCDTFLFNMLPAQHASCSTRF